MRAMMVGKERKYRATFRAGTILRLQDPNDNIEPDLATIEKWCRLGGTSLAEFFAQFEGEPGRAKQIPGHVELYGYLAEILVEGNKEKIEGILRTLKYLAPRPLEVDATGQKPVKKRA